MVEGKEGRARKRYAKNLKLSRDGNEEKRGAGGRRVYGKHTESALAYNLKTHSAFKLLTMAAGYKVCATTGGGKGEGGGGGGGTGDERARFKSLIYLRGDCGRHDGATAGRSGRF